ncbi:MAG: hypothetical protein ACRD0D_15510, partial [Acidimicrobiales bacterium]
MNGAAEASGGSLLPVLARRDGAVAEACEGAFPPHAAVFVAGLQRRRLVGRPGRGRCGRPPGSPPGRPHP